MRVKKYLALTLAAILATTMLTACPWDQEEDKTDDASSVPVTSTDTSQDDDDHDSGDDDSGQEEDNLTRDDITITESQNGKIDNVTLENTGTYTITFTATPTEKYIASSVSVTGSTKDGGSFSGSWSAAGSTATFARASAETTVTITPNADYKKFTVTDIPANTEECNISVTFADLGYVIEGGTYKVHSVEGLLAWNEAAQKDLSLSCTLTVDINLQGKNWTPIGNGNENGGYTGTFNGDGHTISGLQVSGGADRGTYIGLFGYVGNAGTVQNVNLADVNISGLNFVGGVAGCNYNGTIQGCMVSGSVSGNDQVGGVVGYNASGSNVEGCCFAGGSVSGSNYVGGVVGRNADTVEGCCFAGDSVSGSNYVGGVAGDNFDTVKGCCFAGSSVSGSGSVGGVVGYNGYGSITDCYWQEGQDGSPSKGVGDGDVAIKVENGEWTDAIDVMNSYIKGTGYQYKLENSKPVLVASNTNTPEVSGLTQRVLDVARTLGL